MCRIFVIAWTIGIAAAAGGAARAQCGCECEGPIVPVDYCYGYACGESVPQPDSGSTTCIDWHYQTDGFDGKYQSHAEVDTDHSAMALCFDATRSLGPKLSNGYERHCVGDWCPSWCPCPEDTSWQVYLTVSMDVEISIDATNTHWNSGNGTGVAYAGCSVTGVITRHYELDLTASYTEGAASGSYSLGPGGLTATVVFNQAQDQYAVLASETESVCAGATDCVGTGCATGLSLRTEGTTKVKATVRNGADLVTADAGTDFAGEGFVVTVPGDACQ